MPHTPQHLRAAAQIHWVLGLAFGSWGWEWGARRAFRDAVRANPRLIEAQLSMADSFARSGRWDEAAIAYRQAARLQPSNVDAQGNLVLMLVRAGQPGRGVEAIEGLVRARPGDPLPHLLRGALLLKLGRRAQAIRCYRWAAQLPIDDDAGRFTLGPALVGQASWRRAVQQYRQARDLAPRTTPNPERGHSRLNTNPGHLTRPTPTAHELKPPSPPATPRRTREVRSLNLHRVWRARRAAAAETAREPPELVNRRRRA